MAARDRMDAEQAWTKRVEAARTVRKQYEELWQRNLDAYKGTPLKQKPSEDWVNVTLDAALVDTKRAQLFNENPDISLTASEPLMEGREGAVAAHEIVLNELLGPDHLDMQRVIDQVLFSVECPAGLGPVKVGFTLTTVQVETMVEQPIPDPLTGQPAVDPLTGTPMTVPVKQSVDVPIHESWFIEPFSPKQLLIPHDFKSTQFDKAPWLGLELTMPKRQAMKEFGLNEDDFTGAKVTKAEHVFDHGEDAQTEGADDLVAFTEVWYRAAQFDDDVVHPEVYRRKVLIEGVKKAIPVKDPSPYQTIDPATGRLTPDSMIGNPIHVFSIRDVTDTAYPPSDCSLTRALVEELCKFRTQMVQQRDRSIPLRGFDIHAIDEETAAKLKRSEFQTMIPMNGPFANSIWEIARAQYPRENYTAQDYILQDVLRVWHIDLNQMGLTDSQVRTATETATVEKAMNVSMGKDRARILSQYVRLVAKLDALVQRFMTPERYAEILGQKGAQLRQQWDGKVINARLAYHAQPDSSVRMDAAVRQRQLLDVWRFFAQDPNFARVELSKPILRAFGLDPDKLIVEQLPEQGPEPPAMTYSIKMDDFLGPQAQIAVAFANAAGMKITPEMLDSTQMLGAQYAAAQMRAQQAQTQAGKPLTAHGGMAPEASPMDKHQDQVTGAMQGMGVQ